MSIASLPLLAVVLAASIGVQEDRAPVPAAPAGRSPVIAAESSAANQAALSATAEQTARIVREQDQNARNLAAFAEAQAAYARNVKSYEAEKATTARRVAEEAAAYQAQLAAWRAVAERHQPVSKPAAGDAPRPKSKHPCGFEMQTGSNMPVRVCH